VVIGPSGAQCVAITSAGKIVKIKPLAPGQQAAQQALACQKLIRGQRALPFPKGAPETGGGGMAAEVSSWG
jgi:hypothetical protein